MIIPMLCVTIVVILDVLFLLPRVARLMIHTPTAISMFVCLSMVQLMAVFISFFFQAEDGFRDLTVTGVQTCALPIYDGRRVLPPRPRRGLRRLFRRHESRRRRRRYLGRRAVVGVAEFRPVPRAGQRPDPRDVRIDRKSVV